ncbi:MAG: YybH family protein [Janthinobacterium lividum]
MAQDEAAIRTTLAAYNAALNGGAVSAVLPLYTDDGICMAPFSPSSIGQAGLRKAYEGFFREVKFDVKFDILEVSVVAPDWAYVRTASAGATLHHSTGKSVSEANQELFVMRKGTDGQWRIARYSFSPTNPPAS